MYRRLAAMLSGVALLVGAMFVWLPTASAVTCGGEAYVTVYEFEDYSTTHHGYNGRMNICYPNNITNFFDWSHGEQQVFGWESHICGGVTSGAEWARWDNCISSIRWQGFPSSGALKGCFYSGANYGGTLIAWRNGNASTVLSGSSNNAISSFRWRGSTQPC